MAKLLGTLLVAAALAAAVGLVPVGGRTLLDRWRRAPTAAAFASRAWGELAAAAGLKEPPPRRAGAAREVGGAAVRRVPPVERHTDSDRQALERIVSERAQK
jgi:hypothetical protein